MAKTTKAKTKTTKAKTKTTKAKTRRPNPEGGWYAVVSGGEVRGCFASRSGAETRCREIRHRGGSCDIRRVDRYRRRGTRL